MMVMDSQWDHNNSSLFVASLGQEKDVVVVVVVYICIICISVQL